MSQWQDHTVTSVGMEASLPKQVLVEITSSGNPPVYRFESGSVRVGRDAENEIVIADPLVSRTHVVVRITPTRVEIADNDTKNGTIFHGARIALLPVRSDATVILGKHASLRVRVLDASQSALQPGCELVGGSATMQKLRAMVERMAATELPVLIEGETGTGKEVVARWIHAASPRASKPFVVFDCAAVAPSLIASELFGHVKGAYTGAVGTSTGAFRLADGGTLFLDEIGELPLELQPALLRALERREVKPVGSDEYQSVNVRIVAATNRSLEAEVNAGRFRKDLLFRLAVGRIKTPSLDSRREDVPELATHFASALGSQITPAVLHQLAQRSWPGNVRELRNAVERAVMFAGGPGATIMTLEDVFEERRHEAPPSPALPLQRGSVLPPGPVSGGDQPFQKLKQAAVESFEREYLVKLIEAASYNLSEAARMAGVDRGYLRELYRKYEIDVVKLREDRKPGP